MYPILYLVPCAPYTSALHVWSIHLSSRSISAEVPSRYPDSTEVEHCAQWKYQGKVVIPVSILFSSPVILVGCQNMSRRVPRRVRSNRHKTSHWIKYSGGRTRYLLLLLLLLLLEMLVTVNGRPTVSPCTFWRFPRFEQHRALAPLRCTLVPVIPPRSASIICIHWSDDVGGDVAELHCCLAFVQDLSRGFSPGITQFITHSPIQHSHPIHQTKLLPHLLHFYFYFPSEHSLRSILLFLLDCCWTTS